MSAVLMTALSVPCEPALAFAELGELAPELVPAVRALVAHVLAERRDHPDVEDCCHETFVRAAEAQARWDHALPLRPWVLGIARHVALDARRRRQREASRRAGSEPAPSSSRPGVIELLVHPGS